mmetsp:Transcript_3853/g.7807  ORF Transcript_3853/g.7807 Transcript_3853/m.7807 type:complete len:204 (+) Transcript_3853:572-1183(+)
MKVWWDWPKNSFRLCWWVPTSICWSATQPREFFPDRVALSLLQSCPLGWNCPSRSEVWPFIFCTFTGTSSEFTGGEPLQRESRSSLCSFWLSIRTGPSVPMTLASDKKQREVLVMTMTTTTTSKPTMRAVPIEHWFNPSTIHRTPPKQNWNECNLIQYRTCIPREKKQTNDNHSPQNQTNSINPDVSQPPPQKKTTQTLSGAP